MSLVVAIVSDREQSRRVEAVVRGRVGAELVVGATARQALAALDGRIPDLILIPALLSPRDEATVAKRLRALGPAAAHVQAITVPLLDDERGAGRARRPWLRLLRRKPPQEATARCDPAIFADQVAAYLERARAERAAADEPVAPVLPEIEEPAFAKNPEPASPIITTREPDWLLGPDHPRPADAEAAPRDDAAALKRPQDALLIAVDTDEPRHDGCLVDETTIIDLSLDLDALAEHKSAPDDDVFELELPAGEVVLDAEVLEALETGSLFEPSAPFDGPPVATSDLDASEPGATTPADVEPAAAPGGRVEPAPGPGTAQEPQSKILHRLEASSPRPPSAGAEPLPATRRTKEQRPAPRPLQDEWGLFDPEQCGFAALVARLEELTRDDQNAGRGDGVSARVISYG
jgi:CheY-like chemotaxis protein